ncbi:beta-xylosidase [Wenyingzhuangia heitensis]|uniref:Beta-xylosidase n=1 Tax=Wenyingzhuangia heitensis TaxID=1487859 RepID=A0ABX0U7K5_9FLAO|nr:family 43 glycosylhydrolase [Wenyingzhuangia heitensis]NIJ44819.1 beta-xylosidase [Wenyingzhuangia heitensis]
MKKVFSLLVTVVITSISYSQNPFIKHKYTADPSARVFNGRLYVYTSHDRDDATYFDMLDWACFSTDNMKDWKDHGAIFSLKDISWAEKWAWAPDAVKRNNKYYLYYPVERKKIGVAVANKPEGPFKDIIGKPLVDGIAEPFAGAEPIDPAILIDDDGQAYMYFGCREARVVKLKENMVELDGSLQEVIILDKQGKRLLWKEKSEKEPNLQINHGGDGVYGEGPWMFKRNGLYYYVYSNGWSKDATMIYATSQNPMGPFVYQGKVMKPVSSGTSHGSIVTYKNQWYVFYHTQDLSGNGFKRSICVDKLFFNKNGDIIPVAPTKEGVKKVD